LGFAWVWPATCFGVWGVPLVVFLALCSPSTSSRYCKDGGFNKFCRLKKNKMVKYSD
jgi:hypothetical protein